MKVLSSPHGLDIFSENEYCKREALETCITRSKNVRLSTFLHSEPIILKDFGPVLIDFLSDDSKIISHTHTHIFASVSRFMALLP